MNQQQKINTLIIVLLVFLLLATVLIFARFVIGKKILTENQRNIDLILKSLEEEEQLKLNFPVFKTSDPTQGDKSAGNTIFIFSSFSCPYCQEQAEVLNQLLKNHPQQVFLVWKDLVGPLDPLARSAAMAARCAQSQDSFWQFHDYLYANQDSLEDELYQTIATNLNLNLNNFNQCLASGEVVLLIESDIAEAASLGVDASPYLFVNGQRFSGALTLEQLEENLNLR